MSEDKTVNIVEVDRSTTKVEQASYPLDQQWQKKDRQISLLFEEMYSFYYF